MISLIAAISKNYVLGKNNQLLWHLPEDFKRFKKLTSGHAIIMGRKTYESIGRALPNRSNIVISRDRGLKIDGCIVVHSLNDALLASRTAVKNASNEEIFIIGGGEIYKQTMPMADKLYLTIIDKEFEGDTFFPAYENEFKKVVFEESHEHDGLKYRFVDLEK